MTEDALAELAPQVGVAAACEALGRSRATHYRHHRVSPASDPYWDRLRRPSRSRGR